MAGLWLQFEVNIARPMQNTEPFGGVIFSNAFIPNREAEPIIRDLNNLEGWAASAKLKFWFDLSHPLRSGFMNEDGDDYDPLDDRNFPQVFCVGGGPLKGRLYLEDIEERALTAIRDGKLGDTLRVDFGMYVVKKLICPQASRFIQVLKYNYGQYWLQDLEPWDGDRQPDMPHLTTNDKTGESLGGYCRRVLNLQYCLEDGGQWIEFLPDNTSGLPLDFGDVPPTLDASYISQQDWHDIGHLIDASASNEKYYAIAHVLMQAHELRLMRQWDYGLRSAVTALDMALDETIERELGRDSDLLVMIDKQGREMLKKNGEKKLYPRNSVGKKLTILEKKRPDLLREAIAAYHQAHHPTSQAEVVLRQWLREHSRHQCDTPKKNEIDVLRRAINIRNVIVHKGISALSQEKVKEELANERRCFPHTPKQRQEHEIKSHMQHLLEATASLLSRLDARLDVRFVKQLYLPQRQLTPSSD